MESEVVSRGVQKFASPGTLGNCVCNSRLYGTLRGLDIGQNFTFLADNDEERNEVGDLIDQKGANDGHSNTARTRHVGEDGSE